VEADALLEEGHEAVVEGGQDHQGGQHAPDRQGNEAGEHRPQRRPPWLVAVARERGSRQQQRHRGQGAGGEELGEHGDGKGGSGGSRERRPRLW
jgi:hypothetical protein